MSQQQNAGSFGPVPGTGAHPTQRADTDTEPTSAPLIPAGLLLEFDVLGDPAPQGSKRAFRNPHSGRIQQVESSAKVQPWRADVVQTARDALDQLATFVNPVTRHVKRGVTLPPRSHTGPAFEYADGTVVSVDRRVACFPLDGPVAAVMVFTFRRPRSHYRTGRNAHLLRAGAPARPQGTPDLSKLVRSTEDALTTAGVWVDDARVVEYTRLAKVFIGEDRDALDLPGARIKLWSAA